MLDTSSLSPLRNERIGLGMDETVVCFSAADWYQDGVRVVESRAHPLYVRYGNMAW